MIPALPTVDGGFGVIVADPAWHFENRATRAAAVDHYEDMTRAELIYLPVKHVAAPNAHLAIWTTDTHKELAYELGEAWGFKYKCDSIWVKTNDIETQIYTDNGETKVQHALSQAWQGREDDPYLVRLQIGLGNYFRHAHETVLFFTRGKAASRLKSVPSVFFAPRREHSQKPEILQTFLEQMGNPPGLELFANRQRSGWVCWGQGHGEGQAEMAPPVVLAHEQPGVLEQLQNGAES